VLGIDLREPARASELAEAYVYDYVRQNVNAPADFTSPDNLALDKSGNLYITEDPSTPPGADIWAATPVPGKPASVGAEGSPPVITIP
jgi:secreted PhoX family phosphatase